MLKLMMIIFNITMSAYLVVKKRINLRRMKLVYKNNTKIHQYTQTWTSHTYTILIEKENIILNIHIKFYIGFKNIHNIPY